MNPLLAKVTKRGNPKYFKLLEDNALYFLDENTVDLTPYNPDHNLDDDSWFVIYNFSEQNYCLDFLRRDYVGVEYNTIRSQHFERISFLINVRDSGFYFQRVTPSFFLNKKFLLFGGRPTIEQPRRRLVINETPDAVYFSHTDRLVFRDLSAVNGIFPGIDTLYKEATEEETEEFLNQPFIDLRDEYSTAKVGKQNRKRIALAIATLRRLPARQRKDLFSYVTGYCDGIAFDNESKTFSIGSDSELKLLLYGIEQRFYTTPFSNERRLANSIRVIEE